MNIKSNAMNAVERAFRQVGGQRPLARLIGISPTYANKIYKSGHVPSEQVVAIEKATGVPRRELRPDLYDE